MKENDIEIIEIEDQFDFKMDKSSGFSQIQTIDRPELGMNGAIRPNHHNQRFNFRERKIKWPWYES